MLKPLHDNVILKKEEVEKKTASGIILTDVTDKQPAVAKVVAIGSGKVVDGKVQEIGVKVNDMVVYKEYSGTKVEFNSEEYLIVSQDDILAIVE
ncbi:MAG: co-chaperone GroES [Erysipelotrichaceae bacterium]